MRIRKNSRVTEGYKKLVLGFVIIAVILIAFIFYFSSSKAVIKITPKVTAVETDFVADVVTDGAALTTETLQGMLFETEVEGALDGEATGSKLLEAGTLGKVTLINNRSESQVLVKTTRLLTDTGILLRLNDRVNVPAKGEIEAEVYADDPNAFEELAPTKFIIPGLSESLQDIVYAESKATLKSTGESIKVVKAVDIARTKDKLTEELYKKAIQEFTAQLPNKNYTTIVVSKKVLEEDISEEVDAAVDEFTASLKLAVVLIGLDQNKIIDLAGERLRSIVPDTQELLNVNLSQFSYKVQNYNEDNKSANIKVHLEGDTVIRADHEILAKDKLSGLSPKGVELYLANFDEVEAVEVELFPFWLKKVPRQDSHVNIMIENSEK